MYESIGHVAKIREKLKARFGGIYRDLELVMVKADRQQHVPAIYLATAIGIGYSLFFPFTYPVYYAPIIIIAWALIGLLFLANAKKKHKSWTDVGQPFAEEK